MTDIEFGNQSLETNHAFIVEASTARWHDILPGCGKAYCGLWGSGVLRLTEREGRITDAKAIIVAAGCAVCSEPTITNGDIGVLGTLKPVLPTRGEYFDAARKMVAEKTQIFVQPTPPEQAQ
jgi:hypothetical protein